MIPMTMLSVYIIITKPHDWFLMESYWGFNLSLLSNLCSLMAHYSKWWNSMALITSELAFAFNVVIVPAYWTFEWSSWARDYAHQSAAQNIEYATAATVHSTGIICSIIELVYIKMVFLKSDSKWCLLSALVYIPVNYFGGLYSGKAIYWQSTWLNWSRPWVTLGVWLGQTCIQYGVNYITAIITQRIQGFDEKTMTFKRDAVVEEEDKLEIQSASNTFKEGGPRN